MSGMKINLGSEFRCGPVVDAIVANMTIAEKFRLLRQIKKANRRRSRGSASRMSGWKDSIERAFDNQRNICHVTNFGELRHIFNTNGEQCVLPDEWLNKELKKFKQLLLLCPNLTEMHCISSAWDWKGVVSETIYDIILTSVTNLRSLTLKMEMMPASEESMEVLCKRKDKMEFKENNCINLDYARELIESKPNMKVIHTNNLRMNFELKELSISNDVLTQLSPSGSILGLCSYFQKFNSNYRKSSADGIWLREIQLVSPASRGNLDELATLFTELERISLHCHVAEIGRLKIMTNVRRLTLQLYGVTDGESEHIEQLLSHLSKLEEMNFNCDFMGGNIVQVFRKIFPHLKRLSISIPAIAVAKLRHLD